MIESLLLSLGVAFGGIVVLVHGQLTIYWRQKRKMLQARQAWVEKTERELGIGTSSYDERFREAIGPVFIPMDEYLAVWDVPWYARQTWQWSIPLSDMQLDTASKETPRPMPRTLNRLAENGR